MSPPPLVIAHRGDSAHRPENTLASFTSALESGAEIVELDVHLTRDAGVVVVHDPTVERTTNGKGRLLDMTLSEVRALSAGFASRFGDVYAGERIPLLAEVLALLRGRARVMIELKRESVTDDAEGGLEARTVAEVRRAGMSDQVALISFDRRALLRCRELAPEMARGHLFYRAEVDEVLAGARAIGSQLVMPEKGMLSDELRERTREAGIRVATWVVDDPAELAALLRYDLYGVGTNRPGAMIEALQEAG
jgi:glycerophosphoryl diester phosphodiesterase